MLHAQRRYTQLHEALGNEVKAIDGMLKENRALQASPTWGEQGEEFAEVAAGALRYANVCLDKDLAPMLHSARMLVKV